MAVQSLTISICEKLDDNSGGSKTKPKQSSGHRLESAPGLLSLALLLQRDDSWKCCPTSGIRQAGDVIDVDTPYCSGFVVHQTLHTWNNRTESQQMYSAAQTRLGGLTQ